MSDRNSPCFCGSCKKYKKCHSDIHPESRAAHTLILYQKVDKKIYEFYEEFKGERSLCSSGCTNCCYDDFAISQIEFELIMHEIQKNWTTEEIKVLFARAIEFNDIQKEESPDLYKILEMDGNENQSTEFIQAEKSSHKSRNSFPCPFLNVDDGMCTVYNVRPFVCRTMGTTHFDFDKSDHSICEIIPSSLENKLRTTSIDSFLDDQDQIFNYYFKKSNKSVGVRRYPIYYWFKILLAKNDHKEKATYIKGNIDFKVPIKVSNVQSVPPEIRKHYSLK